MGFGVTLRKPQKNALLPGAQRGQVATAPGSAQVGGVVPLALHSLPLQHAQPPKGGNSHAAPFWLQQ